MSFMFRFFRRRDKDIDNKEDKPKTKHSLVPPCAPPRADREFPPQTTMLNHFSGRVPIKPIEDVGETMLSHSSGRVLQKSIDADSASESNESNKSQ